VKSSSSIADQLPINNKFKGSSMAKSKPKLFSIREEPTSFGKKAELFRDSMMTPQDRVDGKFQYDILTGSYRPKA
jgi:hypothetical protein